MSALVCERKDGICYLCGADPHEDCPLTDMSPEIAEWADLKPAVIVIDPRSDDVEAALQKVIDAAILTGQGFCKVVIDPLQSYGDECESCQ